MDNKEGTIIGIGCLALCSLYYFYHQFSRQTRSLKHKRRQLQKVQSESVKHHSRIDYQTIRENKAKQIVIIPTAQKLRLNPHTYKLYFREVPKKMLSWYSLEGFVENQTGGKFTINHQNQELTVDIKNCTIDTSVLKELREPTIFFEENKSKDPLYYSLTYTINSMKNLALLGTIKYSLSEQKFILEPQFILKALKSEVETVDAITAFWDEKIYKITFKKLVIGFAMLTIGYFLIYRPIKNIWTRYKARGEGVSEGQFDYFKEKVVFRAVNESCLNCQFCKANSISYIYECGHLAACEKCHQENVAHLCPICNKKSKKHMKIFI